MTAEFKILLGILGIFVLVLIQFWYFGKKQKKEFLEYIKQNFGTFPDKKYHPGEFERIQRYYRSREGELEYKIDDITWNDLDLDRVFIRLNHTYSSVGEEYLYYLLRSIQMEERELLERERLIQFFTKEEKVREELGWLFHKIGQMRKYSLSDVISYALEAPDTGNGLHYSVLAMFGISIFILFIQPAFGICFLLFSIVVSIVTYYREKGSAELYYSTIRQVIGMLSFVRELEKLSIPELKIYTDALKKAERALNPIKKNIWILGGESSGSIADVSLEYIRLLTHIDLIKFHSIIKVLKKETDSIKLLVDHFGYLESMIAIASYRKANPAYAIPIFEKNKTSFFAEQMVHPLIDKPVPNSIKAKGGVLLTGSNASGKSTFLKTTALNAILAQTIHTVCATSYHAGFFSVLSSMALTDNLSENESYYIVEIRSLKRILDEVKRKRNVLCFIDEVLRGTNTVERIAASVQILKSLTKPNVICFAATHDIELTELLKSEYQNYHFQEEVSEKEIHFDYKLYSGRAISRNAIRLLGLIGYEKQLIEKAEKTAEYFLKTGEWQA